MYLPECRAFREFSVRVRMPGPLSADISFNGFPCESSLYHMILYRFVFFSASHVKLTLLPISSYVLFGFSSTSGFL